MEKTEKIRAHGHCLVQATHKTTFEITKKEYLTRKGNCIISVKSDKTLIDLNRDFKECVKKKNSEITITIEACGVSDVIKATGDPRLTFDNKTDIVVRKSNYVCGRTLAINSNKGALDLSRKLVEKLKDPNQIVIIYLSVRI
jgi:hypothetical protein